MAIMQHPRRRSETRIPVSKSTRLALEKQKRGGESYDTLVRRYLISTHPKPLDEMDETPRRWVLNEDN